MKQTEYLRELKENLEGKLAPETVKDILSDYESFFQSGREDGKSDDEISAELGSPAFLAKSLFEEQDGTQTSQMDKSIADPGRRLCAFLIDAAIAVLPMFVVTGVIGSAMLSFLLLIEYPSPLIGTLTSMSYASYTTIQEDVVIDINNNSYIAPSKYRENAIRRAYNGPSPLSIAFAVFGIGFYMLYSLTSSLIFRGQTIGKRLMHIKVMHSNKESAKRSNIFIREFLGKILINSIPIIPLVSLFTILFTREHKALHDLLADTIVVEV